MANDIHLCPSCAAHLRVAQGLHVMRCNNCQAELVLIDSGGVSGLAFLPPISAGVPYSSPAQREAGRGVAFDTSELLFHRRRALRARAARSHALWTGVFLLCVASLFAAFIAGMTGGAAITKPGRGSENGALLLLGAMMGMPVLGYIALYLQGRARLALENARKWS